MPIAASFILSEEGRAWHLVVLHQEISEMLIANLRLINSKSEMDNFPEDKKILEENLVISQETVPLIGDEVELVEFIADDILSKWQMVEDKSCIKSLPEILVFNNKPDDEPYVRKISTILFDGQEIQCITTASLNE